MNFSDKVAKAQNEIEKALGDLAHEGVYDVDDFDGCKFHGSFLENGTPGPNPAFRFYFKQNDSTAWNAFEQIQKRCPEAVADGVVFSLHTSQG